MSLYPLYLKTEEQKMHNPENDSKGFREFLEQTISNNVYDDSDIEGIVKQTISRGTLSLSEKQLFRLNQFLEHYKTDCAICNGRIPWEEVFHAEKNICENCNELFEKSDY